MYTHINSL